MLGLSLGWLVWYGCSLLGYTLTTRTTIGNAPMTGLGPGLAPGTGLAPGPGSGSGPGSGLAPGSLHGSGLGLETRARDTRVGDIGNFDRIGLVAADPEWGRSHEGDDPHPSVSLDPVVSLKPPVIIDFPVSLDRGLAILNGDGDDDSGGGEDADGGGCHGDNNANDDDVPLGHAHAIDLYQSQSPAVSLTVPPSPHVLSIWIDHGPAPGQELGQSSAINSQSSSDSRPPSQILLSISGQSPGIIDIPAWKDHLLRSLE